MTKKIEDFLSRTVDFTPVAAEERAGEGDKGTGKTLEGYAAVFNEDTPIRSWEGSFNERIAPGAFKKTLKERTPVMQFDHGRDSRFGSLPIGNFTDIHEDNKGLFVRGDLFEHAAPIAEAIRSGAVSGMSFKFGVVREAWHDKNGKEITSRSELADLLWGDGKDVNGNERGPLQRTIKEVKLMEAGPVVFPAYPQTSVGVRSASELSDEDREALLDQYARGLRAGDSTDGDGDTEPDDDKPCNCDKVKGKHTMGDHPKTSGSKGDGPAMSGEKSEDDTSEAPEAGSDADESRDDENPEDAAQAGTSTGLTKNARERALRLLDLN